MVGGEEGVLMLGHLVGEIQPSLSLPSVSLAYKAIDASFYEAMFTEFP